MCSVNKFKKYFYFIEVDQRIFKKEYFEYL